MGAGAFFSGLAGGVFDVVKAVEDRNRYENDRRYQSELQQTIFDREDTAVQRRVADLEAAGLNKNLAAGSAAGAGSVVGRSTSPQMTGNPIGAALDAAAAATQIKNQQIESQILNNQKKESENKAIMSENAAYTSYYQSLVDQASLMYMLTGEDKNIGMYKDGEGKWNFSVRGNLKNDSYLLNDSPLFNQLKWQNQNLKNSADMLQKDADFYNADKIAEYLGIGASIFGGAGRGYRAFKGGRY